MDSWLTFMLLATGESRLHDALTIAPSPKRIAEVEPLRDIWLAVALAAAVVIITTAVRAIVAVCSLCSRCVMCPRTRVVPHLWGF